MEFLAGIGGLVWIVVIIFAFFSPIFLYLTQRNTYQTRQELRKLNKSIDQLITITEKQQQPSTTPAKFVKKNCPICSKTIKYRSDHCGKKKTCPECNNIIVLD